MSEITVTGSVGQFGRLETIKDTVVDGVGYTKGTLLSAHFGQIERDHVLNNVTRGLFDITDERAAAVFVERFLHTRIGDNRTYLVPDGLGYTPGTGGSLTLIDHFCEQDMINIQQNSENPKFANFLESVNLTPEELQESYKKAFELDRLLVNNRMGDDMDENVHLAMSQDTYLNKKTAEELNSLSDRLSRNKNQDGKAAARSVERILQAAQARRDHTHAVKNFVQEGTRAYHTIVKYENRALNAAKELIAQVEFMHGKVDPAVVARFESKTPSNILSPEQAYNEAAVSQGLKNLKNKPKTFAGPGRFIPNYPT
ncbi:MAG: hypothetical protein M1812_007938 [Candelaria pacifica]|nr:MAG: hypothetical protein M1812_007938 [Candelaria pacifica]